MGVKPGPIYRKALSAVLAAKLNGQVPSRKEELDFARHYIHQMQQL